MLWFVVEFKDGKETRLEADIFELRDGEWVFLRDGKVCAQYDAEEVRGVRLLPPGPVKTCGGGSY
jgi:hypothetical protein